MNRMEVLAFHISRASPTAAEALLKHVLIFTQGLEDSAAFLMFILYNLLLLVTAEGKI